MMIVWQNLDLANVSDISRAIYSIVGREDFTSEDLRAGGIYLPSGVLRRLRGDGYIVKVGRSKKGSNVRYLWKLSDRALYKLEC